jgi:hypothetical protein
MLAKELELRILVQEFHLAVEQSFWSWEAEESGSQSLTLQLRLQNWKKLLEATWL